MSLHKEINFETEICQYLGSHGWLYSEGDAVHYDAPRALYLPAKQHLVRSEKGLHFLDIQPLRPAREADQVGEQDRHDSPLATLRRCRVSQRRGAAQAEPGAVRILLATFGAKRHAEIIRLVATSVKTG